MGKKFRKNVANLLVATMVLTSTISYGGKFFSYRFDNAKDVNNTLVISDNTPVDMSFSSYNSLLESDVEKFVPHGFDESNCLKKALDEQVHKLNVIRASSAYSVVSDKKNKLTVIINDDEDNDDDDSEKTDDDILLSLVDMNLCEYKQELKAGANLRTLLEENQVADSFDNKGYNDYKNILQTAVNNGAISLDEMNHILNNYVDTLELINA